MSRRRVADALFLAALFTVSFIGLRWHLTDLQPKLADFLMAGFLVAFAVERGPHRWGRPSRPVAVVLACAAALAVVYAAAAPAIDDRTELEQLAKGLAYFGLHFAFLAAGVSRLASRSARFFRVALACLLAGIAVNGAYAGLQLVALATGHNLDAAVVSPLTGNPARSMSYGLMYAPDVPRARGLTRDPNHLGVMLLLPVLALAALAVRPPPARGRRAAAAALGVLLVVLVLTLCRSAVVGLAAGLVFLVLVDRRRFRAGALVPPVVAVAACLALLWASDPQRVERAAESRIGMHGFAGLQHFRTYELAPRALSEDLLFGAGLNNFGVTYAERVGGVLEASHSYYVQSLVETGLVGTALFALFLAYAVHRLRGLPRDLLAVLGAALVGTLAANAFYMTMSFSYFYALLAFVLAAATRFAPAVREPASPPAMPERRAPAVSAG